MRKIAVLTSGGDSPGMNAAIRAVVRTAIKNGIEVVGIKRGYNGLINAEIEEMERGDVSDILHKGGTILKTARSDEFKKPEGREKAAQVLKIYGIDGLVVIGGDGTFTGAAKLAELGINTIGIPGTIDNDLAYTDYTIGFDTALNTVTDAINKIKDTSASHERVSIVEVMGRHCGDLALYAGVAGGAEVIIVPEIEVSKEDVVKIILDGKKRGKHHYIVLLAEGAGNFKDIAGEIEGLTGFETRTTTLGHIQRGGSPTVADRVLASKLGHRAVELLMENKSSRVVGIKDNQVIDLDIHEALAMKKEFDYKLYKIAMDIN